MPQGSRWSGVAGHHFSAQVMKDAGKICSGRSGNRPTSSRHAPNHPLAIGLQHSHSRAAWVHT